MQMFVLGDVCAWHADGCDSFALCRDFVGTRVSANTHTCITSSLMLPFVHLFCVDIANWERNANLSISLKILYATILVNVTTTSIWLRVHGVTFHAVRPPPNSA